MALSFSTRSRGWGGVRAVCLSADGVRLFAGDHFHPRLLIAVIRLRRLPPLPTVEPLTVMAASSGVKVTQMGSVSFSVIVPEVRCLNRGGWQETVSSSHCFRFPFFFCCPYCFVRGIIQIIIYWRKLEESFRCTELGAKIM